jgi:hypothetical protein
MPRKKKAVEEVQESSPLVPAEPEAPVQAPRLEGTDEDLIQRYFALKDWLTAENKRFEAYIEPYKKESAEIETEFLRRLNDRGANNTKTDFGTAYKSTLLNVSVSPEGEKFRVDGRQLEGRDALLEAALENWNDWGNELLLISAQKDAVKRYMEEHEGRAPPGIKTALFTRVNIKRS